MATSSPVSSSKGGDSIGSTAAINGNTTPQRTTVIDTPRPNLRGLNKPKCIKCGNVARSRCPFQSCKSCCFKAQNPCHIHVLKQSSILPDKPPPSRSPSIEQPSIDIPSTGSAWRLNALKQLPHNFLNALRAKKPLNKKDVANINKWKFAKLREYIEGNIEAENEAFERYLQNVALLEEIFVIPDELKEENRAAAESTSEDKMQRLVSEIKIKLKSNSDKEESFRERIRNILDQKLEKLREKERSNEEGALSDDLASIKKRGERTAALNDLIDKMNRARGEEDLISCLEMRSQLFRDSASNATEKCEELNVGDSSACKEEAETTNSFSYSLPFVCIAVDVDQRMLSDIDAEFASLSRIVEL
ncbi:uncharacterized protein LOC109713514 [Ananas comosus]|uniref:Uncharacterized protein LOC109713514 n=1 Tax=Ananas comosus TaxID=4615 RepID=A0A6P5FID6_ANACO|nr:uncharacterized protein LOC109713514 [Ananas comosus]XP_020093228.1 uncharacterized protein LOC109713514 [Ananas comosus]